MGPNGSLDCRGSDRRGIDVESGGSHVGTALTLGLVFEVVGSFGIAISQYGDPTGYVLSPPWAGLSWVAVWMLAYTVIVPSPPRKALVAALLSVSSVPIVVGLGVAHGAAAPTIDAFGFFFVLVLPYLLVVVLAYMSAWSTVSARRSRARVNWGAIAWRNAWAPAGWARCGVPRHRLLARPAAIKLMRPEVLGGSSPERQSELQARFEREAQATASLRSPHTIELSTTSACPTTGAFYYVMELLDGVRSSTRSRAEHFGPVPGGARGALYWCRCATRSAEAHAAGLVHRDIKPAERPRVPATGGEVDFVKVLDFGLVKSGTRPGGDQTQLQPDAPSRGGRHPGVHGARTGDGRPAARRAVRHLCGRLSGILARHRGAEYSPGAPRSRIMMHHAQTVPVPPSARTEVAISKRFDAVVLACLEKDPNARPATADALAAELAESWPDRLDT